jgi:hypothetical protein
VRGIGLLRRPELRFVRLLAAQTLLQLVEEARGLYAKVVRDEVPRRGRLGLRLVVVFLRHVR